ncbi:dynein light chain Tctex-type protein 2B-like isoform X2 [Dermacentor andersoni]|uniref:dynein light chain Tctex-type protein 2B-like isoform X2 n=1 Tax=Dermacentor andersoni TaxID=34620 RepID=UPI0021556E62|nr:dynein light chain Tctex-type protein 2B-like isoform X3 [Dermacentor andersoni]
MAANTYELRLAPDKKFSAQAARECLKDALMTEFDDKIYDSSQVAQWTKETSQRICERLQELGFERYKYVVQVVISEQRGEGARMACRCLWDSDTDVCVSEFYNGDSLFCAAVVLASYYY